LKNNVLYAFFVFLKKCKKHNATGYFVGLTKYAMALTEVHKQSAKPDDQLFLVV
jgi:hypothetical protein